MATYLTQAQAELLVKEVTELKEAFDAKEKEYVKQINDLLKSKSEELAEIRKAIERFSDIIQKDKELAANIKSDVLNILKGT